MHHVFCLVHLHIALGVSTTETTSTSISTTVTTSTTSTTVTTMTTTTTVTPYPCPDRQEEHCNCMLRGVEGASVREWYYCEGGKNFMLKNLQADPSTVRTPSIQCNILKIQAFCVYKLQEEGCLEYQNPPCALTRESIGHCDADCTGMKYVAAPPFSSTPVPQLPYSLSTFPYTHEKHETATFDVSAWLDTIDPQLVPLVLVGVGVVLGGFIMCCGILVVWCCCCQKTKSWCCCCQKTKRRRRSRRRQHERYLEHSGTDSDELLDINDGF